MATTTKNGAVVPTGSDPYALTADLRKMMESAGLIMPVTSLAQRDAIPSPFPGMTVLRLDRLGSLEYFDGRAWVVASAPLPPIGHLGKTDGFAGAGGLKTVGMTSAQILRGGMTVANNGLRVPRSGVYELRFKAYWSGGSMGTHMADVMVNGEGSGVSERINKQLIDDVVGASGIRELAAGDLVTLQTDGPAANWGTDGFNGTWVEAVYIGPAETY